MDRAAPLLPVLGVADGTADGDDGATEAPGVGVPDDVPAEGVGLTGVDPVGVADGVLVGCVVAFRVAEWPNRLLTVVPEP